MNKVLLTLLLTGFAIQSISQNVNGLLIDATNSATRNDAAAFEINAQTQTGPARYGAFLLPRVNSTSDITGTSLVAGLQVYQTGGTAGIYYYDGSVWLLISASSGSGYIENRTVDANAATGQNASFDITGSGEIGTVLNLSRASGVLLTSTNAGVQTVALTNDDITGVNNIVINDDGNGEGITWQSGRDISMYTVGQGGYNAFNFNTSATFPYIFNTGSVGIGTTNPAQKLEISGGRVRITDTGGGVLELTNSTLPKTNYIFTDVSGHLHARTDAAANHVLLQTGGTQGNVGIGAATPQEKLDVNGSIQIGYNTANTSTISKRFATGHSAANVPSILQMGVDDGCGVMGMHIHNVRNGANTFNDQYITFTTHAGGISCGERLRITETGVVRVANLAGTGSRFVVADASGNLSAGTGTGSGIVTGVGVATRVAFWNSTSDLSSNVDLYWDNTNSRLGVGTATPSGKIHAVTDNSDGNVGTWGNGQLVVGQAAASGASSGALGLSYSTTNNTGYISSLSPTTAWRDLGFRALNTIFYYNGATEGMRLNTSGNLGIGITNPGAFRLNVFGDARIGETAARHYLDIASNVWPEIRFTTPSFTSDMRIGMAHAVNGTYGVANGDWYVYSPGVDRMDLIVQRAGGISLAYAGGNVGVGTNAAGYKFDVNGSAGVGYLHVKPQDGALEGGEIQLIHTTPANTFQIDNYNGNARIHTLGSGKVFQIIGGNGVHATGAQFTGLGGGGTRMVVADNNGILGVQAIPGGVLPAGSSGQTLYHNGTSWTATSNLYNNGGTINLGQFTTGDIDEWPYVTWLRPTPIVDWDEGLIKGSSARGAWGRAGFGIHMHSSRHFGFYSTGWDPLVDIEGGTGRMYIKGNTGIGTTNPGAKLHIGAFNDNHLLLTSSNNAYGWRVDTRDNGGGSVPLRIFRRTNSADTEVLTILNQNGNVGLNTATPGARLDIEGGAFLGYETSVTNFGDLLKSGFYQDGGGSITGETPDQSHSWQHLITARHSNTGNNHQLQIAGSYAVNDRLFFRKIAATPADNPSWNEFATRGVNQFGGQTTNGASHYQWEGATYRNPADHTPTLLVRADNPTTGINGFRPALTLYNFNGAQNSTVGLVFASNEASGVGNTVNLSGIMGYKESAGTNGAWSQGGLLFFTKNMGTRVDAMKISAAGRVDILQATGGDPYFTGLEDPTSAEGRAQVVLSSSYSDLIIASSQGNDNHGSTLTFATYNPGNANDYRKFVINQGNWGARRGFLDFGYSDAGGRTNPHSNINGSDNVMVLDGFNKRVGIGTQNPLARLHVHKETTYNGTAPADWSDRSTLAVTGTYPNLLIASSVNNTNHAGTLSFWHNNNGGGTTTQWNMGASDVGFTIGYATNDGNPHTGIENYQTPSVMSFETNGFVGIRTISPENTLHVNRASTDNRAVAQFTSPGNNSWGYVLNLRTTGAGNDGAKILFRNRDAKNWGIGGDDSGSNDFVINEDGGDGQYGSGFGTTRFKIFPSNGRINTYRYRSNGNWDQGDFIVERSGALDYFPSVSFHNPGQTAPQIVGAYGTDRLNVANTAGNFTTIAASGFTTISDLTMKKEIYKLDANDFASSLESIRSINSIRYKYLNEITEEPAPYSGDVKRLKPHIGFSAQSLPNEVVVDDLTRSAVTTKEGYVLGYSLNDMDGLLVAGVKALDINQTNQNKVIEELKNEIAELKQLILELQSKK